MSDCSPLFYIYLAALILLLPLEWILSVITASLVHELGHILAVRLFRGRISKITVSLWGCEIESCRLGDLQKLISIFAGPAASFALLLFRRRFPLIAVCGLLQGFYNLLPILPMDGGHILQILLFRLVPGKADRIMTGIRFVMIFLIIFFAIRMNTSLSAGILGWLFLTLWILKILPRKTPCKQS